MNKIKILSLLAIAFFASLANAQQKMLSIDDIYDPQKRVAFSGRPLFVAGWNHDSASYRTFKNGQLVSSKVTDGTEIQAFDSAKFAAALAKTGIADDAAKMLAARPFYTFSADNRFAIIENDNDLYWYDSQGGVSKRLTASPDAEENEADFSPDATKISFVRGNNLFVIDTATGRETQLTKDGGEKILNGVLDWVYEEELYGRGNKRGYFWSPDSRSIAFLRTDEKPVKQFVIVNHEDVNQTVEYEDYPKSGAPNPFVKLGVVKVADITTTFIEMANYQPEDFLISRIAWSPDSKNVVWQGQNREQTFLDLNASDAASGKTSTMFRETSPAWVEVIDNPSYLKDGSFIWQSAARSGWKHLYHFDKNGKLLKPLTQGEWEIRDFYGVDEKNGFAYFLATKDSHIAPNVYRVRLDGSKIQRLTPLDGSHNAAFSPDFAYFTDSFSDANTPPQTRLYKADGTLVRVLEENKVPVLSEYKLSKPEFLKVKTRDGFEMEAMMIRPPNFDPTKKYPVFSYTYSGPHAPSVKNAWGGATGMWYQMLAQNGYIVWICDNRTASGKGAVSEYGLYKNFGASELRDLEDGVNYLKSLPYVDGSRIGISGWSFGGFMTSYALTHSNLFKIGIAGGSVTDWRLYDSIYTERYMKTPQNNAEGYTTSSVSKAAKNLNGKLLLVHGVIDDNVHIQNSLQFVYELQKAGKQFEFMPYPTQRHGVVNPLQVKHMRQMMTDFILKNL